MAEQPIEKTGDDLIFDLEYLYTQFELLGEEEMGIAYWLALMDAYQETGQFHACQRLLRFIKGIPLSAEAIGHVYHATGDLSRQQGLWDEVDTAYRQAISIFQNNKRPEKEAGALNDYALALQEQQRYAEASQRYQEALVLYESLQDVAGQGQAHSNLGSMAYERGHWRDAAEAYQRALPLLEQATAPDELASVYNNLGVACENLGDLEAAEQHYLRCVDLLDEIAAAYSERGIRILNNLGQLYSKRGNLDKAITFFEWAFHVCQHIESALDEISTRNNMGAVYMEHQQFPEAVACFQRSAILAQEINAYPSQILSLNNLGAAYANLDESLLAETCYRNSLLLSQELGDQHSVARAYNNLGALSAHLGQREEAIRYYQQAVTTSHAIGHYYRETVTLTNIASQYTQLYQPVMAERYFEQAWSLAERQGYHDQLAALCTLQGDAALMQQATYPDAYRWFVAACQHAVRHSPQMLQDITNHIVAHLRRLQQRGQHEAARAFSRTLLQGWQDETLSDKQPEFVVLLRSLNVAGFTNEQN